MENKKQEQNDTENFQCQWCNKKFQTKHTLKTHIETAKYCLKKRNNSVEIKTAECEFCSVKFSAKASLLRHLITCKDRIHHLEIKKFTEESSTEKFKNIEIIKKLESTIEERDISISLLKSTLENQDITIKELEEYVKELEIRVAKEEGYIQCSKEIKPQQNITTTTNYVKNNKIKNVLTTTIQPLSIELVKEHAKDNYTYDLFCKSEAGLLTFIEGIIMKKSEDNEGLIEHNYACTDTSRNNCHRLMKKDPVDWKLDPDSGFINKILDELAVPVKKHYQKLANEMDLLDFDENYDPMVKYQYDSKLNMNENYERSKEFDKKAELYYQNSWYNTLLEEVEPIYIAITTEDKRDELFKNIRNKVKTVASI
jgi:Zinc finger, C2H2 type